MGNSDFSGAVRVFVRAVMCNMLLVLCDRLPNGLLKADRTRDTIKLVDAYLGFFLKLLAPSYNKMTLATLTVALLLASSVAAIPTEIPALNGPRKIGKRCTGSITSLADVAAAELCTTIVVCATHYPYTER
jgi:hypothetical protein